MKIALVTHDVTTRTGQGRVNYELTRHLLERGVEVHCIADEVAPEIIASGASWTPVHPTLTATQLTRVWQFQHQVDQVLDDIGSQFDLILGCGYTLTRPHSINVVHFVHDAWLHSASHPLRQEWSLTSTYQWLFTRANTRWERDALKQAEHIVAVSDKIRTELLAIGLPPDRVHTIYNGVDLSEFHPPTESPDRDTLGLPRDVPLSFFAGDLQTNRKNLDTTLRALVDVPSLHLAIAGSIPGSPYPSLAEQLGVADRTHFLGFRTDMADLMRASDLFVFPSRYEACTLVLIEALASGLPVISAQTTGGVEIVTSEAGFVLDDPNDASTLSLYMQRLTTNPSLRRSMGRTARSIAEKHSWLRMTDRYLDLMTKIVRPNAALLT